MFQEIRVLSVVFSIPDVLCVFRVSFQLQPTRRFAQTVIWENILQILVVPPVSTALMDKHLHQVLALVLIVCQGSIGRRVLDV